MVKCSACNGYGTVELDGHDGWCPWCYGAGEVEEEYPTLPFEGNLPFQLPSSWKHGKLVMSSQLKGKAAPQEYGAERNKNDCGFESHRRHKKILITQKKERHAKD